MKNNFALVQAMHKKFDLPYDPKTNHVLTRDEYVFRCKAMFEELLEYVFEVFDLPKKAFESLNASFGMFLNNALLKEEMSNKDLENQFDALIDLAVFTLGTADRQGFNWDKGFERVMNANIEKELAGTSGASKRGFARDLVKPEGWTAPELGDLIQ